MKRLLPSYDRVSKEGPNWPLWLTLGILFFSGGLSFAKDPSKVSGEVPWSFMKSLDLFLINEFYGKSESRNSIFKTQHLNLAPS